MRYPSCFMLASSACVLIAGCGDRITIPSESSQSPAVASDAGLSPNRNLEVILRGDGFGHVTFRQPKDEELTITLDTWVRDLEPNTTYVLQRATDQVIDDECTGINWLTLGHGIVPQPITTDANGTGREALFRTLPLSVLGSSFDIHFRVLNTATNAVVLQSSCYQFEADL
jgi:hypothetical protein